VFTTLVESRATQPRRRVGTVLSVVAHTVIISFAVYATARANTTPRPSGDHILPLTPYEPERPRPVPPPNPIGPPPPIKGPVPDFPLTVPDSLPHPDFTKSVVDSGFWTRRAAGLTASGDTSASLTQTNQPFLATQVEKAAAPAPGSAQPVYPPMLEESGITGRVVAQFVVDTLGHIEAGSFHVLQTDNDLFDAAVKAALPRMRFYPAEVNGHRVRQLVEQGWVFELRR
jgi:TonB family protein